MKWSPFSSPEEQAKSLALHVSQDLVRCLQQKDVVTLCVPGGSTPALFLHYLSETILDWSRVQVVLNDERWVSLDDSLSNEAMLRNVLLKNEAVDAQIVSLFDQSLTIDQAVMKFNQHITTVLPLDVCVLGMGDDGHTASLFPAMKHLAEALDLNQAPALIIAQVPQKTEQRVSFNLSALLSAQQHYVLIKSEAKQSVIKEASKTKSAHLPMSHLLAATNANIYYTD